MQTSGGSSGGGASESTKLETKDEHREEMVSREISTIRVVRRGGKWMAAVASAPRKLFGGGEGNTWLEAVTTAVEDYESSLRFIGQVPQVDPSQGSNS